MRSRKSAAHTSRGLGLRDRRNRWSGRGGRCPRPARRKARTGSPRGGPRMRARWRCCACAGGSPDTPARARGTKSLNLRTARARASNFLLLLFWLPLLKFWFQALLLGVLRSFALSTSPAGGSRRPAGKLRRTGPAAGSGIRDAHGGALVRQRRDQIQLRTGMGALAVMLQAPFRVGSTSSRRPACRRCPAAAPLAHRPGDSAQVERHAQPHVAARWCLRICSMY
jgi:hypothetical protein